jgi:hypothetical protein
MYQKLTSLNSVLIKDDKFDTCKTANIEIQAEKSCQVGFNVLLRLYSRAFVKRVKLIVYVSISYGCNLDYTDTIDKLQVANFADWFLWDFPTSLNFTKSFEA